MLVVFVIGNRQGVGVIEGVVKSMQSLKTQGLRHPSIQYKSLPVYVIYLGYIMKKTVYCGFLSQASFKVLTTHSDFFSPSFSA